METENRSLKMVLFQRACRDPKSSEALAEFIRQRGFHLHETDSLRKLEVSTLKSADILVIYCCDEVSLGLTILAIHELRLKGLSDDEMGVILVLANDLYKCYKNNVLILSFIHNRDMGIDVMTDYDTAIQKVLPVALERVNR